MMHKDVSTFKQALTPDIFGHAAHADALWVMHCARRVARKAPYAYKVRHMGPSLHCRAFNDFFWSPETLLSFVTFHSRRQPRCIMPQNAMGT